MDKDLWQKIAIGCVTGAIGAVGGASMPSDVQAKYDALTARVAYIERDVRDTRLAVDAIGAAIEARWPASTPAKEKQAKKTTP